MKFCIIILLSTFIIAIESTKLTVTPTLDTCTSSQLFSYTSFQCESCFDSTNGESNRSNTNLYGECSCKSSIGYYKKYDTVTGKYTCTLCTSETANSAPSQDQSRCMTCGASTSGYSSSTFDCACALSNEVLVEKNSLGLWLSSKECIPCPANTVRSSSNMYSCTTCTSQTDCPCINASYERDSQSGECLQATILNNLRTGYSLNVLNMQYAQMKGANTIATLESAYLRTNFYKIVARCMESVSQNTLRFEECNHLANLCVASLYSSDHPTCASILSSLGSIVGSENTWAGWKPRFPFIYYGENPPLSRNTIPSATDLDMNVALSGSSENARIKVILATYSFNGTWLGFKDLSTELSNCEGTQLDMSQFLNFGTSFEKTCNLNVNSLITAEEPKFYDPFIVYTSGGKKVAYPLPIQILSGTDDSIPNPESGPLYRRFFLYDNVLGAHFNTPTTLRYLRFLVSAQLKVILRGDEKIHPPVLTLRYESRDIQELTTPTYSKTYKNSENSDELNFPGLLLKVDYSMNLQIFNYSVLSLTIVLCLLAVIIAILHSLLFLRKREFAMLDFEIVFKFIGELTQNLANVFFISLFISTLYLYWFFKYQNNAFVLLPTGTDLIGYYVFISLGFLLKLIDVLITTYKQTHYDMFFVDWEKPKELENGAKKAPSAWRTIFVARQWSKLSSQRLISLEYTLLLVLMFLEGVGFMYISSMHTDPTNLSRSFESNGPLRFAVTSMIWISIVVIVYIFKKYIYHRFVKSPLGTFVDICSLSNVSVVAFSENNFGYYIHGASVHEHADINMENFDVALYREKEDAVLRRGMIPDANVQAQSFEFFITHKFRLQFNELLKMKIQTFKVRASMNALPSQIEQGLNMRTMAGRPGLPAIPNLQDLTGIQLNQALQSQFSQNQQLPAQPNGQNINQDSIQQNPQGSIQPQVAQPIQNPQLNQTNQNGQTVQINNPQFNQTIQPAQPQQALNSNPNMTQNMMNTSMLPKNQITIKDTAVYKFINPNRRVNPIPELYDAYNDLNEYLKDCINEVRSDYMKRIRKKDLLYRLGVPPQMTMIRNNVMYIDSGKSFSNLFLSGIELKMLIFNIFLFSLVDLMKNATVALIIVYLVNYLLLQLRQFWIRNTIINRTLLSDKLI